MSRLEQLIETMESSDYDYRYRSARSSHTCLICGNQARGFTDEWAELEFQVSGLCQQCQDEFFGKKEGRAS